MANVNQFGANYRFGFQSADAPTISGFSARSAELKFEPEVNEKATDGEGTTEAMAVTKATHRKITGTFTGYISQTFSANAIGNSFNFVVNSVNRLFIVTGISEPRRKGVYVEVSIEAESHALVSTAVS